MCDRLFYTDNKSNMYLPKVNMSLPLNKEHNSRDEMRTGEKCMSLFSVFHNALEIRSCSSCIVHIILVLNHYIAYQMLCIRAVVLAEHIE